MLILSRRTDEAIVLDNDRIKITILSVKGKQVRLGIEAPDDVSVHREEIYNKIEQESRKAVRD